MDIPMGSSVSSESIEIDCMRRTTPRSRSVVLCSLVWVLIAPTSLWAKGLALVVGVGEYAASAKYRLDGPANDAVAVRDVLIRRWGFADADVRVLVDRAATKQAIVSELRALVQRSAAGDDIVVYFSGHGTSALDANELVPLPHGSGAFLPHDFDPSTPERALATALVGRTDALPLYQTLERGGRRVWVISDSCYSGNQARSLGGQFAALPGRFIPVLLGRAGRMRDADASRVSTTVGTPPWPYRNLSFLAASAEGEVARDIPASALSAYPTLDGKPHGAMTDALLRVLQGQLGADFNGDGQMSLVEVHRAVGQFMATRGFGHTPQRHPNVNEDEHGQGTLPLLRSAGAGKVAPAAAPPTSPLQVFVSGATNVGLANFLTTSLGISRTGDDRQADVLLMADANPQRLVLPSRDLLGSWPVGHSSAEGELRGQISQLALDKRWHLLAQQLGNGLLAAEVVPSVQGGNVHIGQKVHFVARPERTATLLLLNIDARGNVTTLYPNKASELVAVPAGQKRAIPGSSPHDQIEVQPPLGMDIQFSIAFDTKPAQLERLMGLRNTPNDHAVLGLVEQMFTEQRGRFSFARTVLRTLP